MRFAVTMSVVAGFVSVLSAETHIGGDLSGTTLDIKGNPYIINQDIVVPEGKKVTIGEGCIFLFKPFTGFQVKGSLTVNGTAQKPVVFTSINDGDHNSKSDLLANPFDWNGILIQRESGTIVMKNFHLFFSVYGIKTQNTGLQIQNGIFKQNGQFHFTINDKIQYVQDNLPFSYNIGESAGGSVSGMPETAKKETTGKGSSRGRTITRSILRYSCLGLTVGGAIGATAFGISSSNDNAYIENVLNRQFVSGEINNTEYESLRKKKLSESSQSRVAAIISGAIGGLAIPGFVVTFFF